VVIVHYETLDDLNKCLDALAASAPAASAEIIVVDNASREFVASAVSTRFPGVVALENDINVGFARAANRGLRIARGRYLLLLNPDAVVAPDTLAQMVRYMDERPDVGCATARLVLSDGRLDLACRRSFPTPLRAFYRLTLISRLFPRSRRFAQYNLTYLDEHQEAEIDAPSGAFMMVRSAVRDEIGLLDERYFMYGEDLDWAFRIKHAGWRVMYAPITTVEHVKRASSSKSRVRTIRAFYEAMRIFYREHYEGSYPRPVSWLTYAAINVREALELTSARISNRSARA
jgi:GT2 family glycosyltransferase